MLNYIKKRELKISIIFFAFSLFLLLLSQREEHSIAESAAKVFHFFVYPIQSLSTNISDSVGNFIDNYFLLTDVQEHNQLLKKEIEMLKMKNAALNEQSYLIQSVQDYLDIKEKNTIPHILATLIYEKIDGYTKTIVINKGKNDGIYKNSGVFTPSGIVGKVAQVSDHYAHIQLIIDFKSKLPAMIQRTRHRGVLTGSIDGRLILNFIPREAKLYVDDIVVTSGLENIFPKGIKIGKIIKIQKKEFGLFQSAIIEPFIEFNKLEKVLVTALDKTNRIILFSH